MDLLYLRRAKDMGGAVEKRGENLTLEWMTVPRRTLALDNMGRTGFRVPFRSTAVHRRDFSLSDGMASVITCVAVPSPP